MTDNLLVLTGNLTADPDLRYTQAGIPVVSFTVAHTPRKFNRETNQWEEQEALFMRCSAWRDLAENVAKSVTKGARVTVSGTLKSRSYQTRDGDSRTSIELDCDEVSASLRFAVIESLHRSQTPRGQQAATQQTRQSADEPWSAPNRQQSTDGWNQQYGDDTPF